MTWKKGGWEVEQKRTENERFALKLSSLLIPGITEGFKDNADIANFEPFHVKEAAREMNPVAIILA